jgi:riboflavin synthase
MENTTLMARRPGAVVNLETDVIGKYVHNFTVDYTQRGQGKLTMEMLLENGF